MKHHVDVKICSVFVIIITYFNTICNCKWSRTLNRTTVIRQFSIFLVHFLLTLDFDIKRAMALSARVLQWPLLTILVLLLTLLFDGALPLSFRSPFVAKKILSMSMLCDISIFQKVSNGFDMRGITVSSSSSLKEDGPLLTKNAVFMIGVGFAEWLRNDYYRISDKSTILKVGVGRDSRASGVELFKWLAEGLESVGGVVAYDVGLCTTPAMFLSCCKSIRELNATSDCFEDVSSINPWPFDGAVSITASHLPSQWNGFKFFTPGTPSNIGEEGISGIIHWAATHNNEQLLESKTKKFDARLQYNFLPTYAAFLKKTVRNLISISMQQSLYLDNEKVLAMYSSVLKSPLEGLKICVNAGNGAGGFLADTLAELGADTTSSLHLEVKH